MKLMTKAIEKRMQKHPLYSHDGEGMKAKVQIKFFNPVGAGTWLITEGEKQPDGDWIFFGYCIIHEAEWGYVSLRELESVRLPFGMKIERDYSVSGEDTVEELSKHWR